LVAMPAGGCRGLGRGARAAAVRAGGGRTPGASRAGDGARQPHVGRGRGPRAGARRRGGGLGGTAPDAARGAARPGAAGAAALAAYYNTVGLALAGNRVLTAVRNELYAQLQRLSLSFHTRARTGDLIMRVTGDVGFLQDVVVTAFLPLLASGLTFVGMAAVML